MHYAYVYSGKEEARPTGTSQSVKLEKLSNESSE